MKIFPLNIVPLLLGTSFIMVQMSLQAPVPNGHLSVNGSHSRDTHVASLGTSSVIAKNSQKPDAICALMVHCMPANEMTKEQKKFLQNPNNWGAQEFNKNGYGNQSNHPSQLRVPPSGQIHGNSSHQPNSYGAPNQSAQTGFHGGTRPAYGIVQRAGLGNRPNNNNGRSRL